MPLISRTYTDIDLNFTAHPVTKDIAKKKDEAAIAASIKNLLLTNHYERLFRPSIGSNLNRLLFENVNNLTAIELKDEIENTIKYYEPRVNVIDTSVTPDEDNYRYEVSITFFIVNRADPINISLFLERVR